MEWITTGTETVVTLFESTLAIITGNPILTACFVAGTIIPIGLKILKKFKKA